MSTTATTENKPAPLVEKIKEVAWKQEALERCTAFDEGKISERDADLVLRDAYRKAK
jgi:hypothetical protein